MKITIEKQNRAPVKACGMGLFLEDVNCAIGGGLYAELLENHNFEAEEIGNSWEAYPQNADVALKIKTDRPLFPENPHYVRIMAAQAGTGMKNHTYGGIYLTKGVEYKVSFWLRAYDYRGKAAVGFYQNGAKILEKKVKIRADGKWRKYTLRFKAKADVDGADFAFTLLSAGMVHADCFSVMPSDAIKGIFRRDLVRLMKEFKPSFLRFPSTDRWKNSVDELERRSDASGIGYYEYFRLAEYLGCKPLPVLIVEGDGNPETIEANLQDVLDLIEFANGGTDTMWGKLRAELGHSAPFDLELVGVQNATCGREILEERIHEQYPNVRIVAAPAPDAERNTPQADSWKAALADAVEFTVAEGDKTVEDTRFNAQLFGRAGYTEWNPNLILFDGKSVYATANYYVQMLFSLCTGDFVIATATDMGGTYASASERKNFTFVKVVNTTESELEAEIEGDYDFGELNQITRMEGAFADCNTLEEPEKLVPKNVAPTAPRSVTLPPHSFSVLIFRK